MRKQKPMSFDELLKDLQGQKTAPDDPDHIAFDKLFNESFMGKYTKFNNFEAFAEKGNFQLRSHADLQNIHEELLDRHVNRETDFADWKSMLDTATREYSSK